MSDLLLIKRFLAYRWIQNLLAVTLTALSIALAVAILLIAEGLHGGLVRAAEPFPMLMGAKGSPNQLVLNGVFLQDQPIGNIGYSEVEKLRADNKVERAVPLAFGDSYGGYRIVGTEPEIFETGGIASKGKPWLSLSEGRTFSKSFEAVLGAEAARSLGLKVGDTFSSIHGIVSTENSESHNEKYTVVGILSQLGSPYDSGILVDISSIWHSHEHDEIHEAGEEHEEHHGDVTAVIILPAGYAQAMQIAAAYAKDLGVQIVFPSKIVIRLFYMMGNIEHVMRLFSWGVIAFALIIIACSLYWFIVAGAREQGIMRALGAAEKDVAALNFEMGMTLVVVGSVAGLLIGHGVFMLLGHMLKNKTSVCLFAGFLPEEAMLVVAVLICGAFCSWLPSHLLGRKDIVDIL